MSYLNNTILLIDKPVDKTSFNVVHHVKRLFKIKKVGHSGTLDKFASGLLVICTGQATKLTNYFLQDTKNYKARVKLGIETDTLDTDGEIVFEKNTDHLTKEEIIAVCSKYRGAQSQKPPEFSALKINGKRASDLVREGKKIDLKSREIIIYELDLIEVNLSHAYIEMDVTCSKGTYIRALARDIGRNLGVGAHLQSLRRIKSGVFDVNNAVTLEQLERLDDSHGPDKQFIIDPKDAFPHFGIIVVSEEVTQNVLNGKSFTPGDVIEKKQGRNGHYLILSRVQKLIAIAIVEFDKWHVTYLNVFTMLN